MTTFPRIAMTRDRANEILRLWRYGMEWFPQSIINAALFATGDLQ